MLALGLSATERSAYRAQLVSNHKQRTRVQIWDLNHNLIEDISSAFDDGQHNIDTSAAVRRSATASFFDPIHAIGLDSEQPAQGAVSPRYMLHASHRAFVDELDRWVTCPLFTGPIVRPTRTGDLLTIEAQGKESLAQGLEWRPLTIKKGTNKVTAIRLIMRHSGERFFRMAPTKAKLTKDIALSRQKSPWQVASSIARGMGRVLFYDATGYLVCRPRSDSGVYRFETGVGGTVQSAAQIGFDPSSIKNLVYVTGGTPKGKKEPVTGHWVAPASNALSPWKQLSRGGEPGFRRLDVSDDSIKSKSEANALAKKRGKSALLQAVSVDFTSLVVPFIEEYDGYVLDDEVSGFTIAARFTRGSVPWTSSGDMSVGSMRRVSTRSRRLKRRR